MSVFNILFLQRYVVTIIIEIMRLKLFMGKVFIRGCAELSNILNRIVKQFCRDGLMRGKS